MRMVVLHGNELHLQRLYQQQLVDALKKDHGELDQFQYAGEQATLADVFDELRSYSLMQVHKLVVVTEADKFVQAHRQALERYADNPVDHATLLLRATTWNRGNLDKAIAKVGTMVKCDTLNRQAAVKWLIATARDKHERTLLPGAAQMMADRLSLDLGLLDGELAKLALSVEPGGTIDERAVAALAGRGSDEQAWMVQDALLRSIAEGRSRGVIDALREVIEVSRQPEVLVVYAVCDLMRKLAVASLLVRQGVSERDIGKQLRLWGPAQGQVMQLARRAEPRVLAAMFARALELDARSKSGRGDPLRNLEGFCIQLTDNLSRGR